MAFVPSCGPSIPDSQASVGVLWKPGAPAAGDQVSTWAQVMGLVNTTPGSILVSVDTSVAPAVVPPGSHDLGGRVSFRGVPNSFSFLGPPQVMSLADGAQLVNPAFFEMITVETNCTSVRAIALSNFRALALNFGAQIRNLGTIAPIFVAAGETVAMRFQGQAGLSGNMPVVELAAGGPGGALLVQGLQAPNLDPDVWSGGAGSMLGYLCDGTWRPPVLSAFLGTYLLDRLFAKAERIEPFAGTTGMRPTGGIPFGPLLGMMYFDTDIGKPVWWDGAQWVDATGAPA